MGIVPDFSTDFSTYTYYLPFAPASRRGAQGHLIRTTSWRKYEVLASFRDCIFIFFFSCIAVSLSPFDLLPRLFATLPFPLCLFCSASVDSTLTRCSHAQRFSSGSYFADFVKLRFALCVITHDDLIDIVMHAIAMHPMIDGGFVHVAEPQTRVK